MRIPTATRALLLASLLPGTALADIDPGAQTLERTIAALFQGSPAFDALSVPTGEARAARLGAAGAFDLVAGAGVQGQRALWSAPFGAMTNEGYTDAAVQASLSMLTPQNVGLQLSGSTPFASTVDPTVSPDQPQATANVNVPLLKFGRDAGAGAEERAAGLHASAAGASQLDAESDLVARLAEEYWRWVGSYEQLKLARRLEGLATDQLKDVDELIAQHARAAVDRLPFVAAAENAAAGRGQAEQAMLAERQSVCEILGATTALGGNVPAALLPDVRATAGEPGALATRARALAQGRPILAYFRDEGAAAAVRAEAARIAKRPDVTLLGQATATRVENATVLTQTELGYYGLVGLQFSLPLQNRRARAAFDQARLAEQEVTLAESQRRNAIDARIDALGHGLVTLAETYGQRSKAADEFEAEYEAERVKFRLGSATGMDVVLAEQQYVNASLGALLDHTAYAVTLARLLHEAGALSGSVRARDSVAVVRRLTTPTL